MLAATVALATVLSVLASIPVAGWLIVAFKPLVFGCALWLGYECLRHLILTHTRSGGHAPERQ